MRNYTTIRFGLGEIALGYATVGNIPAVAIEPSTDVPGETLPYLPLPSELRNGSAVLEFHGPEGASELRDGSVVLEFHDPEGAKVLIEHIAHALAESGHNLALFLDQLAAELAGPTPY